MVINDETRKVIIAGVARMTLSQELTKALMALCLPSAIARGVFSTINEASEKPPVLKLDRKKMIARLDQFRARLVEREAMEARRPVIH